MASSEIRQNPKKSSQFLKMLQQEWRTHTGVLSELSGGAVSAGDFLSTTETLAKECVTKCQEALGEQDLEKLTRELSLFVGISEKAAQVCKIELNGAADPLFKSRLMEVTSAVNSSKETSELFSGKNSRGHYCTHAVPCCVELYCVL